MNGSAPFSDPEEVLSMETEHLPLWRAFARLFAPLMLPGVRILDFGCNRGGLLSLLCREEQGIALAAGIDVDTPAMRSILEQASERNGGRLLFSTASPKRFPGQFDLVISHEVVYLLPDLERTYTRIRTALAPGGHFCFCTGCHTENALFPLWKQSFEPMGVRVYEYGMEDHETALRAAGFREIRRDRLLLSREEYEAWVRDRGSSEPNPAWFPDSSFEEEYYTRVGKMVMTARKE
jgi:SAM-dependent methyltransferase